MKTEQVKQVTDQALGQLINALEQGQSATLTRYLAAMARFHRYSVHNVMLIYTQKDDAGNVAGFHTWRKLGRFVKKGEKGILILAPMIFKREQETVSSDEESQSYLRFKAAYVFDAVVVDPALAGPPGSYSAEPWPCGAPGRLVSQFEQSLGHCDGRADSPGDSDESRRSLPPTS